MAEQVPRVPIGWRARLESGVDVLEPCAALARRREHDVATRLAERLLRRDEAGLAALEGLAGDDWLVVLGPSAQLPWVDGIEYFGRGELPELLLPTQRAPDLPESFLLAAVRARAGKARGPFLLVAEDRLVIPCGAARPIERAPLETWLRRAR